MRIQKIEIIPVQLLAGSSKKLRIIFSNDGISDLLLELELPDNWAEMTRPEKIAWGKAQIQDHLATTSYQLPTEIIYPDQLAPDQGRGDFEDLPGWATWTAAEAANWINTNVIDLASAKVVLVNMAKAIIYLRNINIEQ